jgi:hypothetical protein
VIDLPFIAPGSAPAASPLARVEGLRDLSHLGKLEVRNADVASLAVDAEVVPLGARRTLVLCDVDARAETARALPGFVVDMTAAYAGIEVEGERLLRRLTDLDLERLPAAGKVAGVRALVTRDGDRFRIWFAQELAESVAESVLDAAAGLA